MFKLLISSLTITLLLIGCGTPRIDASSDEKIKDSIQKIKSSLPIEKQKEFEEALQFIIFSQINLKDILIMKQNEINFTNDIKIILNNKSADEVIQEATRMHDIKVKEEKKINEARIKEERKMALSKIKDLEEKKINAKKSEELLKNIEILSLSFEQKTIPYSNFREPIIKIKIKNSTEKVISRIYFEGTVKSLGREIPWIKESFNYSVPGGFESGEIVNWSLSPNMFSKWGNIETPKDAILEVKVQQIDGADEKEIASIRTFTKEDEKELQALKSKYN